MNKVQPNSTRACTLATAQMQQAHNKIRTVRACEVMQGTLSIYNLPLKSHGPLLSLLLSVTDDCVVCSKDWCYSAAAFFAHCFDLLTSTRSCTGEAIASKIPAFHQTSLAQQPARAKWRLKTLQT